MNNSKDDKKENLIQDIPDEVLISELHRRGYEIIESLQPLKLEDYDFQFEDFNKL